MENNELLHNQRVCFEKITRFCSNYNKDGQSRKTSKYLQDHMNELEILWIEFESNNDVLSTQEQKEGDYFEDDVFEKTKALYLGTKQKIRTAQLTLTVQNPDTEQGQSDQGGYNPEKITIENKQLLKKQLQNFCAFEKTVSKINVGTLEEKWELEDSLAILKNRWEAIDKLHWELNFNLQGDRAYSGQYRDVEISYDKLKKEINKKIWADDHSQKSTPKVDIPEFNGNYNQWVSFRDLYVETIHSSRWLTKSQKMQHLKSKLKGKPEKLVQHLNISADNYDSCWDILTSRYENKRLLFSSYANTLLNLPTIQVANASNLKRMHDTIRECVNGLTNIGVDVATWDPLLVHLMLPKLDTATYSDYIHDLESPRDLPDLTEFLHFLEVKFMAFETLKQTQATTSKQDFSQKNPLSWPNKNQKLFSQQQRSSNFKRHEKWTNSHYTTRFICSLCKSAHTLMNCKLFNEMNVATRNEHVTNLQLCRNCLFNHKGQDCKSTKSCRLCSKSHHTLLHMDGQPSEKSTPSQPRSANHVNSDDNEVLLTTAQLLTKDIEGNYVVLRALIDQGSQVSLITENAAQRLRLDRKKLSAVISGVGKSLGNSKGLLTLECKSLHSDFTFTTDVLIMNKLVNNLPSTTLTTTKWEHLQNLKLADPNFYVSGPIDVLLGADIYSLIIQDGVLKQDDKSPVAQHTKLGWILCGNVYKTFNCLVTLNDTENLSKFWENEEIPNDNEATSSDDYCEQHYVQTTERLSTGQYVVQMPMKQNVKENLGKSRPRALSQFLQLERKMAKQEYFAKQYRQFIAEYLELGHMKPATPSTNHQNQIQAFLPHHGVIREESTTTKLRVVFNASMKTDTGNSLNDIMEKGPNLQKDIMSLIIKWRSYKYALTADIEKMFRAIFLHEKQRPLQKIIWRSSPRDLLQEMELTTVTYGTKAAPFLAMRTLKQLADDEGYAFPMAVKALRHQFYMDDVITGHSTIDGARTLQKELYDLLQKGGFTLRKWASNEPAVLQDVSEKQKSQQNIFNFKQDAPTKTLGLGWNTTADTFCFDWNVSARDSDKYTKRMLLSDISKLYDPLGWISPVIVETKLLFQRLWSGSVEWDEPIPGDIAKAWEKIRSELINIKTISIPRWINGVNQRIELHGFCDASEKAYACVIYTRTMSEQGEYVTTLLSAKTKVAPTKSKPSLPRLELCGALLLARLMEKVKTALSEYELRTQCWTDSQVVLAWLQGINKKWDKYISNRTTVINEIVPASQWSYVKSKENPADCATRGLLPSQLTSFLLWWEGPQWLKIGTQNDKHKNERFSTNEDLAYDCCVIQQAEHTLIDQLLEKRSTMTSATRCLAYVLRFITVTKSKQHSKSQYLTINEIDEARERIVKHVQRQSFLDDVVSLQKNTCLASKSKLLNLTPFLDDKGILRVGGRLRNSALAEQTKHPALLPHSGRLTELVIDQAHKQTLHGGVRLTLAQTRQRYWILGGNRAVKRLLKDCVRCHRFRITKNEQIMGDLPEERVSPSRPFTHCGVDFTGHVEVKLNKGRGVKTSKGYIAIFICMATKAVHIELVSDLSSQTFLGALKRMCARRGTPKHMYSDNGTNFKGAAKLLKDEFEHYETMTSPEFFSAVQELEIEWHFLCPYWPSAAGVWEAAVKSMKFHLRRVLGEQKLDFEQFTTLLAQIEACMNSRPLCPMTEDVDDLSYLTPGHFLTGTPIMSLPQEPYHERQIDLRNKWKVTELMHQHLWRRWSKEYLHQLQTKSKWLKPKENVCVGDLVLVKEDHLPPGRWAMARVLDLHPGADGYVRVVTLKSENNILKRPISKLAPLPKRKTTTTIIDGAKENKPNETKVDSENENAPKLETRTKQKRTTRSRKFCNNITFFILSILTLITLSKANVIPKQMINIKEIANNRPMYFDEIGNLQLIHDEWTLLVYYNLTTYWRGTTKIKGCIDHLHNLCENMWHKEVCGPVISQLQHEMQQLTDYNTLLVSQHLTRKKRGYINGVGNLARTLFGVLDENFANKYENDIEKLQGDDKYLLELIKNQTTIVETENNIIKKNEDFMRQQLEVINNYLTRENDRTSRVSLMNEINAVSLTASLMLSNLRRTQNLLLDALTNIHNGHLDLHLLTPSQLVHELQMIAARISTRLTLPLKNVEDNIKDVYKLIYVKARITASYLLLEIHVPLTSDDEYKVFHVIPLPSPQHNGDVISAVPTTTHVAINYRKYTYISIDQSEINQCVQIQEGNYICNTNLPIHSLHNNKAPCEAKMFSHQTNIHCVTTKTRCTDRWIKLHMSNRWLYLCCDSCNTARVLCEDSLVMTNLSNVGTLDIAEGCVLQIRDTTVYAYNHFGGKGFAEIKNLDIYVPDVNTNFANNTNFNFTATQLQPTLNQSEEHRMLDRLLKLQKENENLPTREVSAHDVHQFAVLYLLVAGTAFVAIYILVKRCKQRAKTQSKSTAKKTEQTRPQEFELQEIPVYQEVKKAPEKPKRLFSFDQNAS